MILSELKIGDKFTIDRVEVHGELFSDIDNYIKISPNTDNFKVTNLDEYFDMSNYSFVLNLDTSTLGILTNTQEVTV